jgi:hypothetical protein
MSSQLSRWIECLRELTLALVAQVGSPIPQAETKRRRRRAVAAVSVSGHERHRCDAAVGRVAMRTPILAVQRVCNGYLRCNELLLATRY